MCINRDLAKYCEEEEEEAVELLIDMEESDTEEEEELSVSHSTQSTAHSPTSSESSRAQIGSYVHTLMKSSSSSGSEPYYRKSKYDRSGSDTEDDADYIPDEEPTKPTAVPDITEFMSRTIAEPEEDSEVEDVQEEE